jgi:hypothetical protein
MSSPQAKVLQINSCQWFCIKHIHGYALSLISGGHLFCLKFKNALYHCAIGSVLPCYIFLHCQQTLNPVLQVPFFDAICLLAEICQLPKDEGLCTGNNSRWYFDPQVEACLEFLYSGCRGNRNNFLTQDLCESVCQKYKGMWTMDN